MRNIPSKIKFLVPTAELKKILVKDSSKIFLTILKPSKRRINIDNFKKSVETLNYHLYKSSGIEDEAFEIENGFFLKFPVADENKYRCYYRYHPYSGQYLELVNGDGDPIIGDCPIYIYVSVSELSDIMAKSPNVRNNLICSKIYLTDSNDVYYRGGRFFTETLYDRKFLNYQKDLNTIIDNNKNTTKFKPGHKYLLKDKEFMIYLGKCHDNLPVDPISNTARPFFVYYQSQDRFIYSSDYSTTILPCSYYDPTRKINLCIRYSEYDYDNNEDVMLSSVLDMIKSGKTIREILDLIDNDGFTHIFRISERLPTSGIDLGESISLDENLSDILTDQYINRIKNDDTNHTYSTLHRLLNPSRLNSDDLEILKNHLKTQIIHKLGTGVWTKENSDYEKLIKTLRNIFDIFDDRDEVIADIISKCITDEDSSNS